METLNEESPFLDYDFRNFTPQSYEIGELEKVISYQKLKFL